MSIETEVRDRVIRLEVQGDHQNEKLDALKSEIADLKETVREMRDLFQQARGARWAIVAMAAIGGFIASKIGAFIPWAGK